MNPQDAPRDPAWDAYEQAVMAGESSPPEPPEDYEMSDAFRTWLVDKMRDEIFRDGPIAMPMPFKLDGDVDQTSDGDSPN